MAERKLKKQKKDIWAQIKEDQKNPEFLRAAFEFIRLTTGKSPQ